ncbi:TPA: hypothetical protein L6A07_30695 [Pseudomonas aeruginosa]|nr:hypothetical protein [Pseudomonas aeruginosa]
MEAHQGRDAAGGSMRYAHDSATGHVSWPGTHSLQCLMHKLMRQSSRNRFDSDRRGLADPAQPVRRHRGAPSQRGGDSPQGFPLEASAARSAPEGARRHHAESSGRRLDSATGIQGEVEFR